MIWESSDWKKPLLRMAKRLEKLKITKDITDKQFIQIEKDIFIGFYSIRKLIDTVTKVTDDTKNLKVSILWHPNIKNVTLLNYWNIHELYDLQTKQEETRDIYFISSRIIHSFIFSPLLSEEGELEGILFTSDIDKDKKIYYMDIDLVIKVFRIVGNDYPTYIEMGFNPDTNKEQVKVK